ncbi:UNVERIFIED_CONTAM: hypothetical protein PYX00_004206 [Menopon gallinae]|uniref:Uncharacterized protein n=1 Tax=Menopon gallinae TaxID=328185 RepID=A0AAW2I396_9NEOP
MPTQAEHHLINSFSETNSWTDALPVCRQSAVGSSINQIYREDGNRQVCFRLLIFRPRFGMVKGNLDPDCLVVAGTMEFQKTYDFIYFSDSVPILLTDIHRDRISHYPFVLKCLMTWF